MTSCPSRTRSAAATDESTPPDIATTIFTSSPDQRSQLLDGGGELRQECIDLGVGVAGAEAEADLILRPMRGQSHRAKDVGRLERSRRARRPCRHGEPFEVQGNEQRLGLDTVEA